MRATQASKTAGWVAAARTFGQHLPLECQLCTDPYGVRFADPWLQRVERAYRSQPRFIKRLWARTPLGAETVLYMQLRTRFIDDALREFARGGGTQVVLLGAGYDSRAVRLREELPAVRYFEVDHPATQAIKRDRMPELASAPVSFVSWDFQEQPMAALPEVLRAQGHDRAKPTLTIWEGVTMYLDPKAIESTVAAVATYSTPGSPLVFTYQDRAYYLDHLTLRTRALSLLVSSVGEPFRFGWAPAELPGWLQQRAFSLREDKNTRELADLLFPPLQARRVQREGHHFAIAIRA